MFVQVMALIVQMRRLYGNLALVSQSHCVDETQKPTLESREESQDSTNRYMTLVYCWLYRTLVDVGCT